jgi:predicted nucleic acid-binding protein
LKETELPQLPLELAISTLTMAELAGGLRVARKEFEKARRRRHLRRVEAGIEALPFDLTCAQAYGRVSAAVERIGRKPRGSRVVDLLIAATALAHELPLYTLNSKDLRGLEHLIEIVDVSA